MYIASLFNKAGLFQYFGDWRRKSATEDQYSVDELFFRATSAYLSLSRMRTLTSICIRQYQKQKLELNPNDQRIVFWSPTLVEFLNEFSPFLSTLRIIQNQILPITARTMKLRKQIPMSLADAIKRLDSYGFGDEITQSIRQYWLANGATVRDYRNIDQHYYPIVQHSFLQVAPEEKILVFLPDNPEEKSQRRVSFRKERDALSFFEDSFLKLHNLIEAIASVLGFQAAPIDQAVVMAQLGTLQEGVRKTLALMIVDIDSSSGFEFGHTEERKIYIQELPGK